jgi:phosphoribosylcarboxyaminoimidazole (NCAIR) mutase
MSKKRAVKVLVERIALRDEGDPIPIRTIATANSKNAAVCVTYIFAFMELGFFNVMHG